MTINRRQFLRGNLSGKGVSVRPPWSLPESEFIRRCSRCSACIDNCPERIIRTGPGGFPEINFNEGGCTFCGDCAAVCEDQALLRVTGLKPWGLIASIIDTCVSIRGVTCIVCKDACDEAAILFHSAQGGVPRPTVEISRCTGCGFCLYTCPVRAISLSKSTEGDLACQ